MKKLLLSFLVFPLFFSCKKDIEIPTDQSGEVEVRFVPLVNGTRDSLKAPFLIDDSTSISVELLKFYLSDIAVKQSDSLISVSEIELISLGAENSFRFKLKSGNYSAFSMFAGVKLLLNGTQDPDFNPAAFGNDHPLSPYNSMYWTWASGYVFMKVEGRMDTTKYDPGDLPGSFFYHAGLDTLYTPVNIERAFTVQPNQKTVIELGLDLNSLFLHPDTVHVRQQPFSHTTDYFEPVRRLMGNFPHAIRNP